MIPRGPEREESLDTTALFMDAEKPLPPLIDSANARMTFGRAQKEDSLCNQIIWQKRKEFDAKWAEGEERVSKLVFIGKNLDEDELAASFNRCLATPDNLGRRRGVDG